MNENRFNLIAVKEWSTGRIIYINPAKVLCIRESVINDVHEVYIDRMTYFNIDAAELVRLLGNYNVK